MLQSRLFTKTLRDAPADEKAVNAKLLIRGGFVSKHMAGVYEYLPFGWRVLNRINGIIREEMNAIGAEELCLSILQNKEPWLVTDRWKTANDVMYQFKDKSGKDLGLSWTNEESVTALARHFISSYKDLPRAVYQIQPKFRDEPRAKSGLLRGKEFLMKDLYSFHVSEKDLNRYYEVVAKAYENIFRRIDLRAVRTLASGGKFSEFSDEYQVLCDAGEDTVFYCSHCSFSVNKEIAHNASLVKDRHKDCSGKPEQCRGIEVGNIFKLRTRFSEAFGLLFADENGSKLPVEMASYGIGPCRLMATIVETHHDENGIIWPKSVAPFNVHLIALFPKDEVGKTKVKHAADVLYGELTKAGISVLYDEREGVSAGEKFADCDLIGIPSRLVISEKTIEKDSVEIKRRGENKTEIIKTADITGIIL